MHLLLLPSTKAQLPTRDGDEHEVKRLVGHEKAVEAFKFCMKIHLRRESRKKHWSGSRVGCISATRPTNGRRRGRSSKFICMIGVTHRRR